MRTGTWSPTATDARASTASTPAATSRHRDRSSSSWQPEPALAPPPSSPTTSWVSPPPIDGGPFSVPRGGFVRLERGGAWGAEVEPSDFKGVIVGTSPPRLVDRILLSRSGQLVENDLFRIRTNALREEHAAAELG